MLRLSALQRLDDLVAEAGRLWPAHPELIGRYEDWLREARELVRELPDHSAKLAQLRARAQPPETEAEGSPPPGLHFADAEDRWWHSQLEKLVGGIRAFSDPETGLFSRGISPEDGWGVERRLELAHSLRDGFASGEYGRRWSDALREIRAAYPRLDLAPQMGLVPLGPDPDSRLWEFAHLPSGAPPSAGRTGSSCSRRRRGSCSCCSPAGRSTWGRRRAIRPG